MIGSLRGKLLRKKPTTLLIEAAGVGYEVQVPINITLPEEGSEVFLYIHTNVKEDAIQLYGFTREEDKQVFLKALSVSGIGPRTALSILSTLTAERFILAVENSDTKTISKVPGLGSKTAGRVILELKNKLPALVSEKEAQYDDVTSALINLGYKKTEVMTVLDKVSAKGITGLEALVKESLKYLSDINGN